jgi:hypothetical protein
VLRSKVTVSENERIPVNVPADEPNAARMYDYLLGGYHNFEADRRAARKMIEINPDAPQVMQTNRSFLRRVVSFLAQEGIDQFLDVGSGMPTVGNVHEMVQKVNPAARVVYVDIESVTVHHGEAILADNPNASIIEGDISCPEAILDNPETRRLLDFSRPVAVLLFCVLHFVSEEKEAYRAVRLLRDAVVPGSYVAASHATDDILDSDHKRQIENLYSRTSTSLTMRSYGQVEEFFAGLELVEPGIVFVPLWRPGDHGSAFLESPELSVTYGGVGRKPL